jgi:hypothetical protein
VGITAPFSLYTHRSNPFTAAKKYFFAPLNFPLQIHDYSTILQKVRNNLQGKTLDKPLFSCYYMVEPTGKGKNRRWRVRLPSATDNNRVGEPNAPAPIPVRMRIKFNIVFFHTLARNYGLRAEQKVNGVQSPASRSP